MTPKAGTDGDDDSIMTINFPSMRRSTRDCAHESQVRTNIAGLSREVCESCGRVSVGYVSTHFSYVAAEEDVSKRARS